MANAEIIVVGPDEVDTIVELFNEVFRPARDRAFIERRLEGHINPLVLMAII